MPELNTPGLSQPHLAIMPNCNIACTLGADKGYERRFTRALYLSLSGDSGKTSCRPFEVAPISVKPRLVVLDNGIVGLQYGRPRVHLLFCTDVTGRSWQAHTVGTLVVAEGPVKNGTWEMGTAPILVASFSPG